MFKVGDKVRILQPKDRSLIPIFVPEMDKYIGTTQVIIAISAINRVHLDKVKYTWNKEWLQLIKETNAVLKIGGNI